MLLIEAPAPLDAAGREDEGAAGRPIEREVVRGCPWTDGVAEVGEVLGNGAGRRGQPNQAGLPESVVDVFIGLVPDRVRGQRLRRPGGELVEAGVAPQPELALLSGDGHRQVGEVGHIHRAGQAVLGQTGARRRRGEPRVAPGTGPFRARVDLRVRLGFLVRHQGAVWRAGTGDRWLVASTPVGLVSREELQVDSRLARCLHIRALRSRPVLVVADRQEHFVLEQVGPEAIGVDAARVRDAVPVLLHEPDQRVLVGEVEVAALTVATGDEGAVITQLVGTTAGALIHAGAAVGVVGLPGGVGRLEKHVRFACPIPYDEGDVALAARVRARQQGEVHPGDRRGGNVPRRGHSPVTAVEKPRGCIRQALRLPLRQARRRVDRGDGARSEALIPARAIDGDGVIRRRGVDLEVDPGSDVHAHVGREALDARVTGAHDVPDAGAGTR